MSALEIIIGCLMGVACFLLAHYVNKSDENNQKQWDRINEHAGKINTLETEHKLMKESGGCFFLHHRKVDESLRKEP